MDANLPLEILVTVVSLVLSICVHEYSHAAAAYLLGDDTAARQGRLTLNPLNHIDPIGTLALPIFFTVVGGGLFGWGRPVPYMPTNLTRKYSMRAGEAIISFAGPLSNLVLAIICGGLLVGLQIFGVMEPRSAFSALLSSMLSLNVVLFFFNLLPVPPLDGSKIAAWVFGQRADKVLEAISRAGTVALLIVVIAGGALISTPVNIVINAIVSGFVTILS